MNYQLSIKKWTQIVVTFSSLWRQQTNDTCTMYFNWYLGEKNEVKIILLYQKE